MNRIINIAASILCLTFAFTFTTCKPKGGYKKEERGKVFEEAAKALDNFRKTLKNKEIADFEDICSKIKKTLTIQRKKLNEAKNATEAKKIACNASLDIGFESTSLLEAAYPNNLSGEAQTALNELSGHLQNTSRLLLDMYPTHNLRRNVQ